MVTTIDWTSRRTRMAETGWDFTESVSRHDFHPYPAKYIPEIPRAVLEAMQLPVGSTVIDPFCGSGTTLAAGLRAGHSVIGGDINPIAVMISSVRCEPWLPGDDDQAEVVAHQLSTAALAATSISARVDDIPRADHWFRPDAQRALSGALDLVDELPSARWREFARAAVSAAIVRVSNQDSDTRYAAVVKRADQASMAAMLRESMLKLAAWKRDNTPETPGTFRVRSSEAAAQLDVADDSVDLACFSPPYPNAYEYWLYHKYRMYWLGHDPIRVREAEIGARPHYSRKNGQTEHDFARQMGEVFAEMRRVLRHDGAMVVVVGDSRIGGRIIDNGVLLASEAEQHGFVTELSTQRRIAARRSSFNRAHSAARTHEHVLLFRKAS